MKLYAFPPSPNARKVAAVVAHLHLTDVEYVLVKLHKGEHRRPDFLAINPMGKVPVLCDGDLILWESNAKGQLHLDDARWQRRCRCRSRRRRAGGKNFGADGFEFVRDRAHPFALRPLLGCAGVAPAWSVPVYGPVLNDHDRATHPPFPKPGTVPLDCVTDPVGNGDRVVLRALRTDLTVMAVPGHTRGHLVYWDQARDRVFTGDTLFAGGCGKVFGGSMLDMVQSLDKLASLPEQTEVYCAHEYTLENLRFAIAVDPKNMALLARYRTEHAKRERGMPTLPSTIALEKATNPFLRVLEPDIVEAIRTQTGLAVSTPSANFEALRNWKNTF